MCLIRSHMCPLLSHPVFFSHSLSCLFLSQLRLFLSLKLCLTLRHLPPSLSPCVFCIPVSYLCFFLFLTCVSFTCVSFSFTSLSLVSLLVFCVPSPSLRAHARARVFDYGIYLAPSPPRVSPVGGADTDRGGDDTLARVGVHMFLHSGWSQT